MYVGQTCLGVMQRTQCNTEEHKGIQRNMEGHRGAQRDTEVNGGVGKRQVKGERKGKTGQGGRVKGVKDVAAERNLRDRS